MKNILFSWKHLERQKELQRFYAQVNLQVQSVIKQEKQLPNSWLEANVVLIPKLGKDLSKPEAYGAISLLNVDQKILTTILTLRLKVAVIGDQYLDLDQTGFLPDRYLQTNTQKLLNAIHFAKQVTSLLLLYFMKMSQQGKLACYFHNSFTKIQLFVFEPPNIYST